MTAMEDARTRDIPASCTCIWEYSEATGFQWKRIQPRRDCPWHTYEEGE